MEQTTIKSRAANFTSSQVYKLMTSDKSGKKFGKPFITYVEEKRLELRLGRQLQKEVSPRSASWGTFVQHRVTNTLLDTGCKPTKDVRRVHPTIKRWTGAEDYLREDAVGEIKCFELKKFCQVHDAATAATTFGSNNPSIMCEDCPEIWWQLVSNAILNGMDKVELTLYVPYQEELEAIREEAELADHKFQWIKYAHDDELPYLIKGNHYPNLSSFTFEITETDKVALTHRVLMAVKMLETK